MSMEVFSKITFTYIGCVILALLQAVWADESEIYLHYETTACDREPVDGYPYHFIQYHSEIDWSIQSCPSGYYFNELACDCIQEDLPAKPTEKKIMAPKLTVPIIEIPLTKKEIVYKAEPTDGKLLVLLNPTQPIKKRTTTTTTTTAKKIYTTQSSTTTTPKPKPKSLCHGCIFEGGVGYNPHPSDCDKFISCYTSLGKSREDIRSCPFGKYWDQDVKTCRTSEQVKCKHEKCLEPGLKTYRHENSCGKYWECVSGVSIARCCPNGHAYIEGVGCVINFKCISRCDQKDEPKRYICDKTGVVGKPHEFKQALNGFGYIDMQCAPGTVYSSEICGCIFAAPEKPTHSKINSAKCQPELDLNFNHGEATDSSRNGVHIQVHNVTFQSGAACFLGNGALVIPRFANADIGKTFIVRLKYRLSDLGETNDIQALMYNGDCGNEPTILIGANRDGNYFRLKTTDGYFTDIKFKKPIDGWRTIELSLTQGIFSVTIDQQLVESKPLNGSIAKSQCGLKVGWGHSLHAFKGCIDFVSVYTCPP
ncbi:hypothetical protein CHS0354_040790 [Potamilus streckersoni]|uniref:Chitin-binding type-2 domain-containing protein n=1 Tax=Potamilus streckersoni TaxID=2493646 RepID=A0AAE0VYM2_9BIVA|nr:hypothetical protein CHS0354_040790 [Potamilus streckersoni]